MAADSRPGEPPAGSVAPTSNGWTPNEIVDAFFHRLWVSEAKVKQLQDKVAEQEKSIKYFEARDAAEVKARRSSVQTHVERLQRGEPNVGS